MSQENGWNPYEVADGDLKLVNGRWVWNDERPCPKDACGPMTDEEIEQMRMAEAALYETEIFVNNAFAEYFDVNGSLIREDVDPFDDLCYLRNQQEDAQRLRRLYRCNLYVYLRNARPQK